MAGVVLVFTSTFPAHGQTTWLANPADGDWNNAANWNPATVPNAVGAQVEFGSTAISSISLSALTDVGQITFEADANPYTLQLNGSLMDVAGAGIINNSSEIQTIVADGPLAFINSAHAGDQNVAYNLQSGFYMQFGHNSSAGDAVYTIATGNFLQFYDNSTSGDSQFILSGGGLFLSKNSTPLSIGSLEGSGEVLFLSDFGGASSQTLQVGSLNNATTFSGSIADFDSGVSGILEKIGTGTLTLTGTTNYKGGTVISGGTLQIGNGGPSGTLTRDVTNNSHLAFNRSNDFTFGDIISGTGFVTQRGTGTLTLTGANDYSGGTTVKAGTLVVDGGSIDHDSSNMIVGDTNGDDGALIVRNGGAVSSSEGLIGNEAGSVGTVTVTGSGSEWTNGILTVGNFGTGALAVEDGGVVSSSQGRIGTGSMGTATVTGAGSQWTSSSDMLVGLNGTGTLTVEDGGVVSSVGGTLGSTFEGVGTATVTGPGSRWISSGSGITVGEEGTGTLTVEDGGVVEAPWINLAVGFFPNPTGTLNIGDGGAAGILDTDYVRGSPDGTATLNFNHTDSDYFFTRDGTSSGTAVEISGSTAVNHIGTGQTTLTGANTYFGGTTLSAGTLTIGSNSALGTGALRIEDGSTLGGDGARRITNDIVVNGDFSVAPHNTVPNFSALELDGNMNLGDTTRTITNSLDMLSLEFGQVNFGGVISGDPGIGLNLSDNGSLPGMNAVFFRFDGTAANTYDGLTTLGTNVSLALNKSANVNAIAGDVAVGQEAVLVTMANEQINNTSTVTLEGNGTIGVGLDSDVTETIATLNDDGGGMTLVVLSRNTTGSTLRVGNGTFSGNIVGGEAGGTSLVKQGAGTLTLSGVNTYRGGTTISDGTLRVSSGFNLGDVSGALTFDGGTLRNDTAFATNREVTLNAGGGTVNNSANLTQAGIVSGPGGLTKTGSSTLTLSGHNTYTGGTTVKAGTLVVDGGSISHGSAAMIVGAASGDNGTLTIRNGGAVSSNDARIGNQAGSTGTVTVTGASSQLIDSGFLMIIGDLGTGTLTVADGGRVETDSIRLTSTMSNIGTGTINIGSGGAAGILDTGDIRGERGTATLNFNHTDSDYFFTRDGTSSGSAVGISASTAVNHIGPGQTTLTGANNYFSGTTISDGTLLVNNTTGSGTGSGNVTVANGATLGGTGTISGATTLQDGATLAPGTSPGTLTVGTLTLNNASILDYELDTPNVVGGGVNDLIIVNGNLTLDGILNITDLGNFGDGTYRLFDYTGSLTDNGLLFGTVPTPFDLTVDTGTGGEINLLVAAATQQFWDGSNTMPNGVIDGGTGTWGAATTNWTNTAGNVNSPWAGGLGAVFAGAAGTVTLADGFSADPSALDFQTSGYTLAAAGTGEIGLSALTEITTAAGLTIISAPITGNAGIAKLGPGTLELSGTNSFDGGGTGSFVEEGTLLVSGTMTQPAANLVVANGDGSNANFEISGAVSTLQSFIGFGDSSMGSASISGGIWSNDGGIVLGALGNGTLEISGTGMVTSSDGLLGVDENAQGTATVSGGSWVNADTLGVGDGGMGALNISGSGMVSNTIGVLGFQDTATGTTNISGGNWDNSVGLILGDEGAGTVNLTGGTITAPNVSLAEEAGSTGIFNVGTGTTAGILDAAVIDGGNGTAQINFNHSQTPYFFTDNGAVSGNAIAITGRTAVRHLGTGTTILNGNNTYTGGTTINAGTLQTAAPAALGTGPVTLNNGTLAPVGELNITSMDWKGGTVASVLGTTTSLLNIAGELTLDGGGQFQFIADGGFAPNTTYNILNAANLAGLTIASFMGNALMGLNPVFTIIGNQLFVKFMGPSTGRILQNSGPVFTPLGSDFLVNGEVTTGGPNDDNRVNSLTFNPDSSLRVFNTLTVTSGNFTVSTGSALMTGGTVVVPGDFSKLGDGLLDIFSDVFVGGAANVTRGSLLVNGSFTTPGGLTVFQNALLGGEGVINGNVFNNGIVAPGNSPGTLTINGNFTQSGSGTLQIEIASPSVFDRLLVSGNASLAGALQVLNLGKRLQYGQQYPFLQAGSITGEFDSILMPEPSKFRGRGS